MYEFISGKLVNKQADHIVIETNGIGYRLKVPSTRMNNYPLKAQL